MLQSPLCERSEHYGAVNSPFSTGPLLTDISQVSDSEVPAEPVVRVKTARVVIANYRALIADFGPVFAHASFLERYADQRCSKCRTSGTLCCSQIDQWLLDNAGVVSESQAKQTVVNTEIEHEAASSTAYRPPNYGRALVIPIETFGDDGASLLDIKGCGLAPGVEPHLGTKGSGLEYLGAALGDFLIGWIFDEVFRKAGLPFSAVPTYAVLDLGFDLFCSWMGTTPAGMQVRRAHHRIRGGLWPALSASTEEQSILQAELVLRAHSVTTASAPITFQETEGGLALETPSGDFERPEGAGGTRFDELVEIISTHGPIDLINIQPANTELCDDHELQVVDFGHFHTRPRFSNPLATQVRDAYFGLGRVLKPGSEDFMQPMDGIRFDPRVFNRTTVNSLAFYCAQNFRSGRMRAYHVAQTMRICRTYIWGRIGAFGQGSLNALRPL